MPHNSDLHVSNVCVDIDIKQHKNRCTIANNPCYLGAIRFYFSFLTFTNTNPNPYPTFTNDKESYGFFILTAEEILSNTIMLNSCNH